MRAERYNSCRNKENYGHHACRAKLQTYLFSELLLAEVYANGASNVMKIINCYQWHHQVFYHHNKISKIYAIYNEHINNCHKFKNYG